MAFTDIFIKPFVPTVESGSAFSGRESLMHRANILIGTREHVHVALPDSEPVAAVQSTEHVAQQALRMVEQHTFEEAPTAQVYQSPAQAENLSRREAADRAVKEAFEDVA
jgi:hypothetical protein